MNWSRFWKLVHWAGGAVIVLGCAALAWVESNFIVELPKFPKPQRVVWTDQGWDKSGAAWFHHADQGTLTFSIPYEWFIALERPLPSLPGQMFANPKYLDRFGFIPDEASSSLPIGFAHGGPMRFPTGGPWNNPATGLPMTGIGLTCAACHTGRLTYRGTEIRVDGAPATTNLKQLQIGLGLALFETRWLPFLRSRFEDRVLGHSATDTARQALASQIDGVLSDLNRVKELEDKVASHSVEEGYGRLDALDRIGNRVFSYDLHEASNYASESAPVHYPRIWDASWFTWVQYDGSIAQPMVRNAGEALGVSAPVTLTGAPNQIFNSGVRVDVVYAMEKMLAGKPPNASANFSGLRAPRWPEGVLGKINPALAAKGQKLYAGLCQGCHLPPVGTAAFWSSRRWTPVNSAGERYLDVALIPISEVGTDASQAAGLAARTVKLPSTLGIHETSFGPALGDLVEKVVTKWYDSQHPPTAATDRDRMDGFRKSNIRAPLAYKARPLDGIWATPPYLHNGSVPSLYDLLSPAAERPKTFYLGNREYDPVKVGLRNDMFRGLTLLDTSQPGNLSAGHEFSDKRCPGVIGPYLPPDERRALVEYLKTL